jgi:hypothetical protein
MLPSIVCLISLRNTERNCSFSASFWRAETRDWAAPAVRLLLPKPNSLFRFVLQ